ncbi:restriction endonuclease subunit S [Saccharothrix luteola]|uniref:restriction endonuclease subunit S n=1 Tax=Saccharothrix luteola TaxID=2893018 RepID=UPI001E616BD5|nr:restriction endonuclease subunit S [Saccharothrix luteola]MCC8249567.1 restriction endonuclease subunit S [Saccharothrix luteola]
MALPAGWTWATLGDVATWGSGGTPKSGVSHYYGGDIPWVVSGDLNDKPIYTVTSTITTDGLNSSSAKWVPEGSVLIAMYGATIGKLAIAERPLTTNQAVAFATPHQKLIDKKFLFWYLRSQREDLRKTGKGGAQPNISQTILKAWPIPIPPLAEQHRIVEVIEDHLSRLDTAERLVNFTISRARRLRESVSSITLGYSVPSGKPSASPPAPSGTDDGLLPNVPPSWSWKRLEEIADIVGGVTKDKKKQSDPSLPEVPYLRVANVQRGKLDLSEVSVIRVPEAKALQLALKDGDVLLNEGGDRDKLGRGWVWENQIPGAIHQNHVFRARIRNRTIHPKLLSWYANNTARWFEINGKQSVNLASISLSKIKQLPVPIPPLDEQGTIVERIEDQLSVLDAAVSLSQQALIKAKILRRSLLNRAFTGQLVLQDPAEEPSSALLDRIRAERENQGSKSKKSTRRPRRTTISKNALSLPLTSTPPLAKTVQQELPL